MTTRDDRGGWSAGRPERRNPFLAARRLHGRPTLDALLILLATGSAVVMVIAMGAFVAMGTSGA